MGPAFGLRIVYHCCTSGHAIVQTLATRKEVRYDVRDAYLVYCQISAVPDSHVADSGKRPADIAH